MNTKFDKSFWRIAFLTLLLFGAPETSAQTPAGTATLPTGEEVSREGAEETADVGDTGEFGEEEEKIYLNVQDQDIKEVIKQISKATGKNFIIDAKVSGKISILSNSMMTREEAYQAFLSALQVAGFTTVQGPAGILKIVSLRDAKNFPIPTHVDTTPYTDSYVTRLIKLENISAGDMADAIKGLISRNGNLFAYEETNTLVLTDSGTNIDRLMKIIKELDQEGPQEVVDILPIHFASAKEIATILESLFEQKSKGRGRGKGSGPEIAQVSKIIADERTNSLIILASKRDLDKVKGLINRLDAKLEEGQEGKIHVHYLKHATAKEIATVMQGLAGQAAKGPGKAKAAEGTVIASLEDFKVAADDATNSLLITATPKTYRTLVDKVLSKLDIPRKQVYLEAMVVEFSFSRTKAAGMTTHIGGGTGSLVAFKQTFRQFSNIIDPFAAGSTVLTSPGLLGGVLSRKTVDIKVSDTDGTTKTVTVPALSAFLNALDSFGDSNIIASPSLLALDNEEASIEIIRKEPEPGTQTLSATGASQTGKPERIEAGLRLKLTPQITERGTVRMKIDEEFSSFATPSNTALGTQAIVERKVATSVITNDGQTVVIGGLMEDKATITKNKIPILGSIPIIGWLFKTNDKGKTKSNLLLFLTPHIIRDSSDFAKILQRKVGQQKGFIDKYYKKKQRRRLTGIMDEHHPRFFKLGEKETEIEGGVEPIAAPPPGVRIAKPPVITARPDDEERRRVTIVLPSQSEAEEKNPEKQFRAFEKIKKKEKKITKQEPSPVYVAPAPAPVPIPQSVEPAPSAPVVAIPPRETAPQAKALGVSKEPGGSDVAPEQVEIPAVPLKKKKRLEEGHAPVITLPPGSPPDLWD